MSDTNHRLECPYCKGTFLNKKFSNHLIDNHLSEIFVNKENKNELSEACSKKEGGFNDPIELKFKDKIEYFVPCCHKFYSKKCMAQKHYMKKECRDAYVKNAKELFEKITPITINNNHSGSGNINNTTIINYNIYDLSGNIVKTIKKIILDVDNDRKDKARYYKKYNKLKKIIEENDIEYDSDVSTVQSYYADDECETNEDYFKKSEPYDLTKELNKKDLLPFIKAGIDLSREGLELRTKEDHDRDIQEKKEILIDELETNISDCIFAIDDAKEDIKDYQNRLNDPEYDEGAKAKFRYKLQEAKNTINKTRDIKEKYEKQLNELRGK